MFVIFFLQKESFLSEILKIQERFFGNRLFGIAIDYLKEIFHFVIIVNIHGKYPFVSLIIILSNLKLVKNVPNFHQHYQWVTN